MNVFVKVKNFLKKITKSIHEFWKSEKVSDLRDDFKDFVLEFGEDVFDDVLKPFIIQQVKQFAKATITGEMKTTEVRNKIKENWQDIQFKDYILDKLIKDVVFELKITKEI